MHVVRSISLEKQRVVCRVLGLAGCVAQRIGSSAKRKGRLLFVCVSLFFFFFLLRGMEESKRSPLSRSSTPSCVSLSLSLSLFLVLSLWSVPASLCLCCVTPCLKKSSWMAGHSFAFKSGRASRCLGTAPYGWLSKLRSPFGSLV